jgi:hypothetical protein
MVLERLKVFLNGMIGISAIILFPVLFKEFLAAILFLPYKAGKM